MLKSLFEEAELEPPKSFKEKRNHVVHQFDRIDPCAEPSSLEILCCEDLSPYIIQTLRVCSPHDVAPQAASPSVIETIEAQKKRQRTMGSYGLSPEYHAQQSSSISKAANP